MATRLDIHPDFLPGSALFNELCPSRRADGWTAERQSAFCDALAIGSNVEDAARSVGLSASSAYSFRNSAKGAAFAIGWTAAELLKRQRIADAVSARALDGQTITVTRPDGSTLERHYYDNRLAMNVLARLDRLAAGQVAPGVPDSSGEGQAARLAAGEWERFKDVLATDGGAARAGLFLAARTADTAARTGAPEIAALAHLARADLYQRTGAGVPSEIDTADLDPAQRGDWTAAQWSRAEASGLLRLAAPEPEKAEGGSQHSQHSPAADESPVWCDGGEWRTSFPPPADFDGDQDGRYGDEDYSRSLSDDEELCVSEDDQPGTLVDPATRVAHEAERDRWFDAAGARADARMQEEAEYEAGEADTTPPVWPTDEELMSAEDRAARDAIGKVGPSLAELVGWRLDDEDADEQPCPDEAVGDEGVGDDGAGNGRGEERADGTPFSAAEACALAGAAEPAPSPRRSPARSTKERKT